MLIYPGQMDPLLIEPKCTEPYYTRPVLPIEECRHADIQRADGPPPLLIKPKCTEPYYTRPVLPIEEGRHADITKADGIPSNQGKSTEPYYTRTVLPDRRMQTC